MDFRRRGYVLVVLCFILSSGFAHADYFGLVKNYGKYFPPRSCPEINLSSAHAIEDMQDLTKIADVRGKELNSIKTYQELTDSGYTLDQYFRKKRVKLQVKNLKVGDIETMHKAVRSEIYKMNKLVYETRVYAAKIAREVQALGPAGTIEAVFEKHPFWEDEYRALIVEMAKGLDDYTIITQFLRKASGKYFKEGVLDDYADELVADYIGKLAAQAEVKGETFVVTDAIRTEAKAATAGMLKTYAEVSNAVLAKLTPSSRLPRRYVMGYPRELRYMNGEDLFSRITYYTEIRQMIRGAGMDYELYTLRREAILQKISFWTQVVLPTEWARALAQTVLRKVLPRDKWAYGEAMIQGLQDFSSIYAHDATIEAILDMKDTLVSKGRELLNRNGNKNNALLIRFATRDDLAWEWDMMRLAAEKATPPNTRLIEKMDFARKIAKNLEGTNGSIGSGKARLVRTGVNVLIYGAGAYFGFGHLIFGKSEITVRENEEEDEVTEPSPSPEPSEAPTEDEEKNEESKPNEEKEEKTTAKLSAAKTYQYGDLKVTFAKGANTEVVRRVKKRFAESPPRSELTVSESIALNEGLAALDVARETILQELQKDKRYPSLKQQYWYSSKKQTRTNARSVAGSQN